MQHYVIKGQGAGSVQVGLYSGWLLKCFSWSVFQAISNNPVLQNRAFQAFAMMLDHYGMKAVFHQDGSMKVERSSNWEERYQNLNK